jgi:hypothetical protein
MSTLAGNAFPDSVTAGERRYDPDTDRLFLVYYALPPTSNKNNWQVSPTSLDVNIQTAVNKPVIIYPHNPANRFHSNQAGNFVHPLPEEASAEMGRPLSEEEYYNWQEGKGVVGRIINVDKREKGYAWTLEITDPSAKQILKSDKYSTGIPAWTSPQILTYPHVYPNEDRTGIYDHWVVSHVILTDNPAFGFEKSALAAKCLGDQPTCMIKTKNASTTEGLGFCVKQAITTLLNSSQKESDASISHNTMSDNQSATTDSNVVVTKTLSEQNQKQEGEQQAQPAGSGIGVEGDAQERTRPQQEEDTGEQQPTAQLPKSLEEAQVMIAKLIEQNRAKDEMLKTQTKSMRSVEKRLDQIESERRIYLLKSVIPRDLFKNDESHDKEVERIISKGLDKDLDFLKGHYGLMKKARLADEQMAQTVQAPKAKSASVKEEDVADSYQALGASTVESVSSTIDRQLNLGRKMFGGNQ